MRYHFIDNKAFLSALIMVFSFYQVIAEDIHIGAAIPWVTYEAEDGNTNGVIHEDANRGNIAFEASGKKYVELIQEGHYVSVVSTVHANRVTVRYSIPRGTNTSVDLYVNNVRQAELDLVSFRIHKNQPALPGNRFRFFDEVIHEIDISFGDEIKLVKGSISNVSYIHIDFIELEMAPAAISKPDDTWFDITDYGASPNDSNDDTQAFKDAISAAGSGSKKVWIPQGVFLLSSEIVIPNGFTIAGAGMWHSVLQNNVAHNNPQRGLVLGSNNIIKNFKFESTRGDRRVNQLPGLRFDSRNNVEIDGVWVENTFGAGIIGVNVTNVTIRNCRVRGTFADAIHVARRSQNCLVENNTVRNAGDDGIANVVYSSTGCRDIVFRNNTVENNYWGRGISIIGGSDCIVERNEVKGSSRTGILIAVETYANSTTPYNRNFIVQHNRIIQCGENYHHPFGGLWVWGHVDSPMDGVIRNNEIIDPVRHGITITRFVGEGVIIEDNQIHEPGPNGQYIYTDLEAGYTPTIGNNIFVTTSIHTSQQETGKILIAPNPMRNQAKITWSGIEDNDITLNIYNLAGQRLFTVSANCENQYIISRENINRGLYLLEIIGRVRYTEKLFVL